MMKNELEWRSRWWGSRIFILSAKANNITCWPWSIRKLTALRVTKEIWQAPFPKLTAVPSAPSAHFPTLLTAGDALTGARYEKDSEQTPSGQHSQWQLSYPKNPSGKTWGHCTGAHCSHIRNWDQITGSPPQADSAERTQHKPDSLTAPGRRQCPHTAAGWEAALAVCPIRCSAGPTQHWGTAPSSPPWDSANPSLSSFSLKLFHLKHHTLVGRSAQNEMITHSPHLCSHPLQLPPAFLSSSPHTAFLLTFTNDKTQNQHDL